MTRGTLQLTELLARSRKAAGLSQESVGAALGVSGGRYGEIERGSRGLTLRYIPTLSKLLKISIETLVTTAAGTDVQNHADNEAERDFKDAVRKLDPTLMFGAHATPVCRAHVNWFSPKYWAGVDAELRAA